MDNVTQESVIRQLFSLLPDDLNQRSLFDRYAKKLTIGKCIQVFIATQLNAWSSLEEIAFQIRAHRQWQELFQLSSISGSQLSRTLDRIPTELLEGIFLQGVARIQQLTRSHSGVTKRIGRLRLIDSSSIRLPLETGDWAKVSPIDGGVKMHLRLVAASPDTVYPDQVIPTTKNVGDRAAAVALVTASDATYVMDRGYDDHVRMDEWVKSNIRFVIRIRDRTQTTVIHECAVPPNPAGIRDAQVSVGKHQLMEQPMRLVEFVDEKRRLYRLLTSRWDLTAEEVAHIYKCRWFIELYFKWMKQHMHVVKLFSYKPQAIWNQIYCALIASLFVQYIQMKIETPQTPWRVLQLLRTYMYQSWEAFMAEVFREPSRSSRGRQPAAARKSPHVRTTVGILKPSKVKP